MNADSSQAGKSDSPGLGHASAAFAMAAGVAVLFNTALTCVKDAYAPLTNFMNALTGHNWTTQGLADVALFLGLGLIFKKSGIADKIAPNRLIAFLAASVVVSGAGLFLWFAAF